MTKLDIYLHIKSQDTPYTEKEEKWYKPFIRATQTGLTPIIVTMYLNVNLTPPPPSAGEGSCTTPKTPEILNSLINLTSPPLPLSYSQYQSQVEGGTLLSPISDLSSPSEESAAIPVTAACTSRLESSCVMSSQLTEHLQSPTATGFPSIGVGGGSGGSGGGGGLVGGSPGTSGTGGPLAGASPPSTPDLPSPVTTMEATKSALIKEGLKHQIRCKMQAAGVDNSDPFYGDSKYIKSESDELTEEDEERRRKRRERNKIAATKCRNKKKEKTIVLMTESESVEDMNVRLKTEIQRLTSEKMKLEKLLGDPNHRASCRHSPRCPKTPKLPLVIVTPADSPDASSSSSSSSTSSSSSSSSSESPTSPPLTGPISYRATHSQASTVMASHPGNNTPSSNPSSCASTSSSQFLTPKYSSSQNQRHHPYQYLGRQLQPHCSSGIAEKQQYCSPPSPSGCLPKMGYSYQCMNVPRTHEFTLPTPPSMKSVYTSAKSRGNSVRYNPYSGRPPPVPSPLATHTHPQPGAMCGDAYHNNNNNNNGCRREDQQTCITDTHTNQFFPPCSYSSM